jgi:serine/threonine-protein kinase
MSPEQARGQAVDKRTDMWSFGCVMYEMLTSACPFRGDTTSATIAAVFDREPDWHALPAETPASIRKLLRRCLEKDRKRRLADIADARLELEEALIRPSADPGAVDRIKPAEPARVALRALPWTVAAAAVAITVAVYMLSTRWPANSQSAGPLRLSVDLGAEASLVTDQGTAAVLSPDATVLAFVAQKSAGGNSQLYIRRLEQLQATALPGTDGARNPFFAPDGQSIAFFAGGKLKKISVAGGDAVTISDALNGLGGGTWTSDGTITFSPNASIRDELVASIVGRRQTGIADNSHRARGRNYSSVAASATWRQSDPLHQSSRPFREREHRRPTPAGRPAQGTTPRRLFHGRYVPSGHLIYMHEGTLFAAVFDLNRLELVGQPVPVLEGVAADLASGAQFAVAESGTSSYMYRDRLSAMTCQSRGWTGRARRRNCALRRRTGAILPSLPMAIVSRWTSPMADK